MQTKAETALTALGYSPREAVFLRMVAAHSGIFLRRQYLTFAGIADGKSVQTLISKLVGWRHGKAIAVGDGKRVYHVSYAPIYRALGLEESTNRNSPSEVVMKPRLMALDFVLAHLGFHYLESEAEKIVFFSRHFGAAQDHFPVPPYRVRRRQGERSTRSFVEKFPIFIVEPGAERKPMIGFSFIDDGQVTAAGFVNFLSRYRALAALIPRLQLFYISALPTKIDLAKAQFERHWGTNRSGNGPDIPEAMLRYFDMREAWEGGASRFSSEEFAELVRLRRAYNGPEAEALYQKLKGATRPPTPAIANKIDAQFVPWLLPDEYRILGELRRPKSAAGSPVRHQPAEQRGEGELGADSLLASPLVSPPEPVTPSSEVIADSALNATPAVRRSLAFSVMQAQPHAGNDPTLSGGLRAEPEVPARRKRA